MISSILHYINETKSLKNRYREIKNWYVVETNRKSFFHNKYCTPEQLESPYLLCNELNTGDKIVAEIGIHSYILSNLVWFIDDESDNEQHDVIRVNMKFSFYDNEIDDNYEEAIMKVIEVMPFRTEEQWLHESYGTGICDKFISNLYYHQLFKTNSWKYIPVRIKTYEWDGMEINNKSYGYFNIEPLFFVNDKPEKCFYYDSICELIDEEEVDEIIFKEDYDIIELNSPKWENRKILLVDYFISDGLILDETKALRSEYDE